MATRIEHLNWCKERANKYLDKGEVLKAISSFCSDLNKHKETENHPGMKRIGLVLNSALDAREFIEGFD